MATDFSRPAIRKQLQEVFRTAADLDTFLMDYFPGVSRRLSSGMSRTERESLLLQLHDPHEIVSAINQAEAANRAADRTHSQTQQKGTSPIVGKPEVPSSQPAVPPGPPFALPKTCFLHVSDVHFASKRQVNTFLDLLEADLSQLKDEVPTLHGIVVSGDLTQTADHGEFQAAQGFLDEICETYKLGPKQLVIVPGNHDGSWRVSEAAYAIAAAPATPDAEKYRQRFLAFADFYQETTTQPYPLDFERQATLHEFKEQKVLFLGLNSATEGALFGAEFGVGMRSSGKEQGARFDPSRGAVCGTPFDSPGAGVCRVAQDRRVSPSHSERRRRPHQKHRLPGQAGGGGVSVGAARTHAQRADPTAFL